MTSHEEESKIVESSGKRSYKGIAICLGVTTLLLIIILVTVVVLFLTILKPKQPQVVAHPVNLTHIDVGVFPATKLEATLAFGVTITNRNYGSFKYENTTAYLYYHGEDIGEAPIKGDTAPARGKENINTCIEIKGDKMIASPYFLTDNVVGVFNFTSLTTLHGKVSVFKVLNLHATAHTTCDISVSTKSHKLLSVCKSQITV